MMYEITYRAADGSERMQDLQDFSRRDIAELTDDQIMDLYQAAKDIADGKVVIDVFGFNEPVVRLTRVEDDGTRTVILEG